MRPVIWASWTRRVTIQAKAQVTGAILRPVQEIIDLLKIRGITLELVLDDSAAPRIRCSIADRTWNALEFCELVDIVSERKLERGLP